MDIFDELESEVQSYARNFPVVFTKAQGATLHDESGNSYIDFLAGAGALNYGHNNPLFKEKLIDYINSDGVTHSLDMHTAAKRDFLTTFKEKILAPRDLAYVCQFTGPTGTNAVEAAMKIARKVTGRTNIVGFTHGFHGATCGSMAATANSHFRNASGITLQGVTTLPFDGYLGENYDTTELLEKMLEDSSSGLDYPAAVLVETVQGEGGLNVASNKWLQNLQRICNKFDVLLIVDDIQAGCGRTGTFFSFEPSGIKPDIVTLSKSLSGYGSPFSLVLLKPEHDQWMPGEHNGTFRGNNHAFITATAALNHYWSDDSFAKDVVNKAELLGNELKRISSEAKIPGISVKGRGIMQGISFSDPEITNKVAKTAFSKGLIIETCGSESEVLKCLCSLTIAEEELRSGLKIIEESIEAVAAFPAEERKAG
ncbi:MAG: diaminobutyrate--2-oxoglutarate transaminase [Gammaproteobacteria bacterium]|nr:MAG: diaminobutyrate--2-oxoglutarate transaminase [Gammaproteobacteria bacterium]